MLMRRRANPTRRPFTTYDLIQLVNALADTMTTVTASDINIASVSKACRAAPAPPGTVVAGT